jgi:hypothetical protein
VYQLHSLGFVCFKASKTFGLKYKKERKDSGIKICMEQGAIVTVTLLWCIEATQLVLCGQNVYNPGPYCKLHLVRLRGGRWFSVHADDSSKVSAIVYLKRALV